MSSLLVTKIRISVENPIPSSHLMRQADSSTNSNSWKHSILSKIKMPSELIIFRLRTSFGVLIELWKTKTKSCLIGLYYRRLFSNANIKLKMPDEGFSKTLRFFARSVASRRCSQRKAFWVSVNAAFSYPAQQSSIFSSSLKASSVDNFVFLSLPCSKNQSSMAGLLYNLYARQSFSFPLMAGTSISYIRKTRILSVFEIFNSLSSSRQ